MTSVAPAGTLRLHAPVRWSVIVAEQFRAIGLLLRVPSLLLLLAFLCGAAMAIDFAEDVHAVKAASGRADVNLTFSPGVTLVFLVVGFVLPLVAWQDEDPSRRFYHWSMPVSIPAHAAAKVAAGWCWLMIVVAALLVGQAVVAAVTEHVFGVPQPYVQFSAWWEWLIPFTSLSVAYVFASAAAVGTRRPIIWLFGLMTIYFGVYVLSYLVTDDHGLANTVKSVVTGYLGAGPAMAGWFEWYDASFAVTLYPSLGRWLGATTLWGALGVALLVISMYRRSDSRS